MCRRFNENLDPVFLTCGQALAAPNPLSFSARIQDASLAEEAIDLLHCMAERSGIAWELGLENAPPPLISMQENSGRLRGKYVKAQGAKAAEFSLGKNEWRQVCENLAEEKEAPSSILIDKEKNFPEMPSEPKASAKKTPWLWIAAGAAVAAGGFIAWRATRPNHHYIMME